ncbi:MAG: 50S ribosomal protein L3 [Mycoplasmataceae bacterium]|nr:50S ribosomal protein L3 [Mycoplasmataceae bacterium]
MKCIVGTKIGMTQVFTIEGKRIPVTIIHCEPNQIVAVHSKQKQNVDGVQVGYQTIDEKKLSKPALGVFKKNNITPKRHLFTLTNIAGKVGDFIKVNTFTKGEFVDVQGTTKGRGTTGAIKLWNFKIGPLSHGAGYLHRFQGSVAFGRGGSAPQRVPKGKKMAARYGHEIVTIQSLIIVDVLEKYDVILIYGAIPGPKGSIVFISSSLKKPNKKVEYTIISKEIQEEILKQNESLENKEALHAANLEAEEKAKKEAEAEEARKQAEALAREKEKQAAEKAANKDKEEKK